MYRPQRHAQSDRAEMANGASVAVASVDPSVAVAQTSPPGLTPMAYLKCNGLTLWHLVLRGLPASNPASSKLTAALDRKSRANGALVGGTVTVDHAQSVAKKKNPLRTSLRSESQATDSTRSGCQAKSAAKAALVQRAPVRRRIARKARAALSECRSTLVAWCPRGSSPKSVMSSMCDSQVSGCQFVASPEVSAQRKPSQPRPAMTCGLWVT